MTDEQKIDVAFWGALILSVGMLGLTTYVVIHVFNYLVR